MVDVQLVILPGLQRLINSCVALHRGVGQDGTPAGKTSASLNCNVSHLETAGTWHDRTRQITAGWSLSDHSPTP